MTAEHAAEQALMLLEQFAPIKRREVQGLKNQDIDTLEARISRTFCVGHRVFLRHFGTTVKGALKPFLHDFEFNDNAIREYYRSHSGPAGAGWVFWANVGADPFPTHTYAQEPTVEDPAIGTPVDSSILYESMWNDILFDAYMFLIAKRFEHREPGGWLWEGRTIPLTEATEPFATLQQLMARLGFEPWIDMSNAQCMMRRGEAVTWFGRTGTMPGPDEWNFAICGPDPRELREVREVLADNAGLVDRPIRSS